MFISINFFSFFSVLKCLRLSEDPVTLDLKRGTSQFVYSMPTIGFNFCFNLFRSNDQSKSSKISCPIKQSPLLRSTRHRSECIASKAVAKCNIISKITWYLSPSNVVRSDMSPFTHSNYCQKSSTHYIQIVSAIASWTEK